MVSDDWLPIGKIVAPQGLRGEVRVYPETQFPQRFLEPGERWIIRPNQQEVESIQLLEGRLLGKGNVYGVWFEGVHNRDQAEALRGSQLLVPSSDRPPLEEGEFHYLDLVGVEVFEQGSQTPLGTISDIINAGNDLLQVTLAPGGGTDPKAKPKTVLIPFVEAIVPVVDLANRRVEITPPPGLLDL